MKDVSRKAKHIILIVSVVFCAFLVVGVFTGLPPFGPVFQTAKGTVTYTQSAFDGEQNLTESFNCTFYTSLQPLTSNQVVSSCWGFDDFYLQVKTCNVTNIVIYQQPRLEHSAAGLNPRTFYTEGQFQLWFYENVPNVGNVAVLWGGYEGYYLGGN
jgi:hypothetical protein